MTALKMFTLMGFVHMLHADTSGLPATPTSDYTGMDFKKAPGITFLPKNNDPNGAKVTLKGYKRIMNSMNIAQKSCRMAGLNPSDDKNLTKYFDKYYDTLMGLGWTHGENTINNNNTDNAKVTLTKEALDLALVAVTSTAGPAAAAAATGISLLKSLKEQAEKDPNGTVRLLEYSNAAACNATINYDCSAQDIGDASYGEEMVQMNLYLFKLHTSSNDSASFFHSYHYNDLDMSFRFAALEFDNDTWEIRNGDNLATSKLKPLIMANTKEQWDKAWKSYMDLGANNDAYMLNAAKLETSYSMLN